MIDVTTRLATGADLEQIVRLKIEMFREAGHLQLLAPDAGERVIADYRELYRLGRAQHFVAASDRIVAMAGAFLKSDLPYCYFVNPAYGFIGDVYTDESFRRLGLAETLSKAALAWLRSKGVHTVRLLASDAGRPLYEKLGFRASDEMVRTDAT